MLRAIMKRDANQVVSNMAVLPTRRSATNNGNHRKPLVVLAGWLGSQPKQLRRYEQLYRNHGFDTITVIGTPYMVFRACLPVEASSTPIYNTNRATSNQQPREPESMQELAEQVLRQVFESKCSTFFFHGFSNAGGFVWEQIRNMMIDSRRQQEVPYNPSHAGDGIVTWDQQLRYIETDLLKGVIFDSCPGSKLTRIGDALSYCSFWERCRLLGTEARWDYLFIENSTVQVKIEQRSREYWTGFVNDPLNTPQLYLFSKQDALIPYAEVDQLVKARQQRISNLEHHSRVFVRKHIWEDSPHIAHLRAHPQEYEGVLMKFLQDCLGENSRTRKQFVSKL